MIESVSGQIGAPVGIYSAYLLAHLRGEERISQIAYTAIKEMNAIINELGDEVKRLGAAGRSAETAPLEKTLRRVKKNRDRAERQLKRILRRIDRQWHDAMSGPASGKELKKFKAVMFGDFVDYQSALVRKVMRINLSAFCHLKHVDTERMSHLTLMRQQTSVRKIKRFLSQVEPPQFRAVSRTISDKKERNVSKSHIIPVSKLQGQLVPDIERTPMIPSGKRASTAEIVNFHVSSYTKGEKTLAEDMNRSAVLAVSRNKFPNYQEVNRAKVRQLFQLELSQQLLRSERYDELKAIRTAVKKGRLDVPPVEVDHVTLSLLTLVGQERKMFQDEYEAMMSFHNRLIYLPLQIEGKVVNVPARFRVHILNTGVAEVSTRRLDTDGCSAKGVVGSMIRLVTRMGKVQWELNQATWKKMSESFLAYEKRMLEKIAGLDKLASQESVLRDKEAAYGFYLAAIRARMELSKACQLRMQIEEAGGPANYDKHPGNPYAMGARVLILAQLIGYSIHWHCKSGKDRTGMMDIEIKYLLESMDREYSKYGPHQMRLPPLELEKETAAQKKLRCRIALRGGNMEVAQANTGEYGLKTTRRKENKARYGAPTAEILAGDSDRVSS